MHSIDEQSLWFIVVRGIKVWRLREFSLHFLLLFPRLLVESELQVVCVVSDHWTIILVLCIPLFPVKFKANRWPKL